jgi:cell division protein FtsN
MSRRNSRRNNNSTSKPAWVWFVLGNFVGGFVVFIIFLTGLKQEAQHLAGKPQTKPQQQQTPDNHSQPRFDFYTLLAENEVAVPAPPKPKAAARDNSAQGEADDNRVKLISEDSEQLVYILQAASFRDVAEAEKLRAQLTLANLDVQVETASDSRGTWHRVLVGPYSNRSQVASARETLADHRLMPLVLKRPR